MGELRIRDPLHPGEHVLLAGHDKTFGREASLLVRHSDGSADTKLHRVVGRFVSLPGDRWCVENTPHPDGRPKIVIHLVDEETRESSEVRGGQFGVLPCNRVTLVRFYGDAQWTLRATPICLESEQGVVVGAGGMRTVPAFKLRALEVDALVVLARKRLDPAFTGRPPSIDTAARTWGCTPDAISARLRKLRERLASDHGHYALLGSASGGGQDRRLYDDLIELAVRFGQLSPADLTFADLDSGEPRSAVHNVERSW